MYSKQGWVQSKASAKHGWVQSKAECNATSQSRRLPGRPAGTLYPWVSLHHASQQCTQLRNAHNTQQCPQCSAILSNAHNTEQWIAICPTLRDLSDLRIAVPRNAMLRLSRSKTDPRIDWWKGQNTSDWTENESSQENWRFSRWRPRSLQLSRQSCYIIQNHQNCQQSPI